MVKDVHGIIANLLDFNAEEILALNQRQRMKALLCAQDTIPIKLLYDRSPREFVAGALDRWIPDIPRGSIILSEDDWIDVTAEGLLINSTHCLERSIVIKHETTRSRFRRYRLLLEGFEIEVTCYSTSSCSYPKLVHDTTQLHLGPGGRLFYRQV